MRKTSPANAQSGFEETGGGLKTVDRGENVFGTIGSSNEFFSAKSYRQYQRETLEEIDNAYEQGYRHVIVDAPTGSGKSHIVRALAFQSRNAHILTIQKLLQDQYHIDFPEMAIMKGRNSYECLKGGGIKTCADGPCRLKKQESCDQCPYQLAKFTAMSSDVTVHNFDSFYYQNTLGKGFGGRKLLIIDEAHNIANKFSDFLSFTINSKGGIDVPYAETIEDYDNFVRIALEDYTKEWESLREAYSVDGLSGENLKRMEDIGRIIHRMKRYVAERATDSPAEYVFDYTSDGRYGPSVTFRPVFVGDYASNWLFRYGERTLMLSATILDKEIFCREIGLNPEETYYIRVPSTFPPANRPIIKKYAGAMGYKEIDFTLPVIAEYVQEIVDRYPGRKGIVQTHSEKIATYLREHLTDRRFTYNKDFLTPQDMLDYHRQKDGSFIVASGLREGLDLQGDMSKVQIFCKIPYPSLSDKVVRRRMELSSDWYGWMTCLMFIQSLGRSVRSPKEKAVTYILDKGFGLFYHRYKKFIPNYIKEAIRW
jgi:ATP-dependent DNA helicase DinG